MNNEENVKEAEEATQNAITPSEAENTPEKHADDNASAHDTEAVSEDAVAPDDAQNKADGEDAENPADAVKAENPADSAVDGSSSSEKRVEEPAAKSKARKDKPQKPATKSGAKGMSKLFKLIYFPAIALFALIMMIFSIVDGVYGYSPKEYGDGYYKAVNAHIRKLDSAPRSVMTESDVESERGIESAREYIIDSLTADGRFTIVDETKEGEEDEDEEVTTVTDWHRINKVSAPTVTVMTSQPSIELQDEMGVSKYLVGTEITNIIAAIPSKATRKADADPDYKKTAGAVVVTVRYDTRPDTYGAADNASFVAVAIESLRDYVLRDVDLKHDLIVVFTEELDNAYGVYTFFQSFKGLKNAPSRAVIGISLDAYGNAGTLALVDASGAGMDYLDEYTSISGSVLNSSLIPGSIPEGIDMTGAVKGFGEVPAIQVAVFGGTDAVGSLSDTAANLSQSIVYQQSAFFKNYVDAFAVEGRDVKADVTDGVFFPYFDWGTVMYNNVAAYVIGALIIALIAAATAVIAVKKTFSVKKLFIALGVEALVVAGALVAMFAAYFLITLMLTGFGVLPIHAITQLRGFNAGIFIAAMFVSLASAFGFTTLFKKLFKVTSSDTVRGTAVLFGIVGAVMSFAVPAYSYLTSWLGLLLTALLLVTACLNGKLKERFGIGFDRLFAFTIPVILCMPFTLSGLVVTTELLPLYMLPVTMMLFTAMLGVIVPYLDRTAVVFDKLAKKLPKRTQRVEHVVIERVEDRAKKGKFTEREVKRVDKEKVAVNYKNYFGVSLIAVVGCVIALISGAFCATFGQSVTKVQAYDNSIYNDSLVYVWERDGSGSAEQKLVIDDLIAYKYMRYAVDGLEWDAINGYYYKTVNYNESDVLFSEEPSIRLDNDSSSYIVKSTYGSLSSVVITIPSAKSITKITVKPVSETESNAMTYEFFECSTIVLRLPYGYGGGNFELEITGGKPSTIEYEEQYTAAPDDESSFLNAVDEWNAIVREYDGQDVLDGLRGGIVLKRKFTSL